MSVDESKRYGDHQVKGWRQEKESESQGTEGGNGES